MKLLLSLAFISAASICVAQPKIITQATITTITNVIAPDEDPVANVQNPSGGNMMMRNFGDGETKSTTYIKNNLVKTVIKTDMGRATIIRDNTAKLTTTLMEMMGNKTGFYITDEEQNKFRDSMMQARRKDSSTQSNTPRPPAEVEVIYTEDSKKIAGYTAKKAYLVRTNIFGKDSITVWYSPEIKFQNLPSTGGTSGFGNMGMVNGLDKVDGFVLQYEMKMPRGRVMQVEVTKIELDKEVKDKEFEIPKDFVVKPMRDMRGQGGNFQFRMRD